MRKLLALLLLISAPAFAGSPGQAPGNDGQLLINNNTQYGAANTGATMTTALISGVHTVNGSQPADVSIVSSQTVQCLAAYGRILRVPTGTSAVTIGMPSASSSGCTQGYAFAIENDSSFADTFSPTGSNCGPLYSLTATCTIPSHTICYYRSNNSDYPYSAGNCLPITVSALPSSLLTKIAGFSADGGGQVIPTGYVGCSPTFTYNATITGYDMTLNITGSAVVNIVKANNIKPGLGNSIVASAPPTITSAQVLNPLISTAVGTWITTIAPNDKICWYVTSASTSTHLDFALYGTVTQ